jgi:hypothetical protein
MPMPDGNQRPKKSDARETPEPIPDPERELKILS